ncbi:hypothetical protein SMQE08_19280 [Serratia marcescens]|uniref:hypothetical protein n=1 Tax=Serratia TaxID=613 RepID=UPI000A98AC13|nr:hypothetical protein [Serratia surfactantfaciens]BEM87242.1 hypothetical protein SME46J_17120 [Serratia marcescens]BEO37840.1 hypothetical protein SMQE08_19280 [Serratia marcescens]
MILLSDMTLSEYDQRQLSLMEEMLDLYSSDKISLKKLIDNLEGLLFCLQSVDVEWKNEFHEHWFVLEQVYAVALFRNESIDPEDPDIQGTLKKLRHLLKN